MTKKERAAMAEKAIADTWKVILSLTCDEEDPDAHLIEYTFDGLCSAHNYLRAYLERQREEP